MGDTVGVALDGDGSGEAGDGDGAVELWEGVVQRLAEPVAGDDEADDGDEEDEGGEGEEDAAEQKAAAGFFRGKGLVGDDFGIGEIGEAHGLPQV